MKRAFIIIALLCAAGAALVVVWALRRPAVPQADFDVLGILWLFANLARLVAFVIAALLGVLSAYLLVKALRMGKAGDLHSMEDEQRRILQDPRFHGLLADQARREPDPVTPAEGADGSDTRDR